MYDEKQNLITDFRVYTVSGKGEAGWHPSVVKDTRKMKIGVEIVLSLVPSAVAPLDVPWGPYL